MGNWIRTDYDFDLPIVTITVELRSPIGRMFYDSFKEYVNRYKDEDNDNDNDKNKLAELIAKTIYDHRPELGGSGLVVLAIGYRALPQRWEFNVCHPNFPKVPLGQVRVERLETCTVCNNPIDPDAVRYMGPLGEVCSQECSESYTRVEATIVDGGNGGRG